MHLQACLLGPTTPQFAVNCVDCKLTVGDDYVDSNDVAVLLGCLSGPDVPSNANCNP